MSFTGEVRTALMSSMIPEIRTFHSLALKIVGYGERQRVVEEGPSYLKRLPLWTGKAEPTAMALTMRRILFDPNEIEKFELFIAGCRAAASNYADAANDPTFSNVKREFIRAYGRCELLEKQSANLDDCLVEAVALLRNDSSLGAHFKHIIVDEYQDVDLIQHDMTRLLSRRIRTVIALLVMLTECVYRVAWCYDRLIRRTVQKACPNTKVFTTVVPHFRFGHELSLMANSVIRRNSTKLTKLCVVILAPPKRPVDCTLITAYPRCYQHSR